MATDRNALIQNIYGSYLDREADASGLAYWGSFGDEVSDDELRKQILSSAGYDPGAYATPLMADSGYNAYLRKMEFNESDIQSSLQTAKEAAQRRITGQAGAYDTQRKQSSDNTNQDFESRGMARSGGRLGKLAENRSNIDYQQNQFESGVQESIGQMDTNAAKDIASLRRERAEQELGARGRLTQNSVKPV